MFKGCQQKTCMGYTKWFISLFCAVGGYCGVTESDCFTYEGAGMWQESERPKRCKPAEQKEGIDDLFCKYFVWPVSQGL